ncbi:tripartite tricarboxylate transporter substrate binding protein [Diaphorobacter sp. HDW4B]|uniref:tripartite tricarboxylate transporter substrate binding protein n=1 Tax=Diaphorobacter sp. HDW4B TaxID=2714925 RepID=UPI00140B17C5|nr:tripartite tricarboxylate transporter substrate binding protein [Diaphorobacter sp. HDW4B]QIL72212.1 tripartite tricarboxylate transporter substrate binding protein [Diaphorobacter sp. HDW4B]
MPTKRIWIRSLAALLATSATLTSWTAAHATSNDPSEFPRKPVHIIVPVSAGGSADKLTRILAEKLGELWKQSVIVENVAGASGVIGAAKVAKAQADGYTLLQQGESLTLNALLQPQLPFDSQKAFTPIIKAVVNPQILVVNPATGIRDFKDYLARANAKPESISLGLPTNGGIAHVAHEILTQATGAKVNYIPYPGGAPAALDVLAGHTDATLITLAAVTEYVRAGKLKALAVTTSYRSPSLPQVPTMAEAGGPANYAVESWQGYFAPAGTPSTIVHKINRDMQRVLQSEDVRVQLEGLGYKVDAGSSDALAESLRTERPKYASAIRAAGLRLR